MCKSPSAPSAPAQPPTPEIKKRTSVDRQQERELTRKAAIARYGLPGTDVTKGAMKTEDATTMKKKLGG
jgi:hypothetical protein